MNHSATLEPLKISKHLVQKFELSARLSWFGGSSSRCTNKRLVLLFNKKTITRQSGRAVWRWIHAGTTRRGSGAIRSSRWRLLEHWAGVAGIRIRFHSSAESASHSASGNAGDGIRILAHLGNERIPRKEMLIHLLLMRYWTHTEVILKVISDHCKRWWEAFDTGLSETFELSAITLWQQTCWAFLISLCNRPSSLQTAAYKL